MSDVIFQNKINRAKIFHRLVLRGKLRSSVQWTTDRDKGGVFQLGGIFLKTGKPVLEVLYLNHPGVRPPTTGSF